MDDDGANVEIVVIGAGISGIYAAAFYLETHPAADLVVLDRDSCIGGTWNSRRSYDSFWTQWTVGTAEFPDLPMPRPPEGDIYYEFFKAKHTTKYLEAYVDHHGLRNRIKLSTEVESIARRNGSWRLSVKNRITGCLAHYDAARVMVASGLTSIPGLPNLPDRDLFQGPVIHQEDFGASNILTSSRIQNITVLGGGKSSADMVYSAVKAGKTVTWILKATDTTGPGFFLSPKGQGPYKNAFEIGMTRIAATFTPSFMNGLNWWTKLLHHTSMGVKMMSGFWETVDKEARKEANFEGRERSQGFGKLQPHSSIFWQNCTGGLLNHEDFFDTIAQHVRVCCADVLGLGEGVIRLQDGETVNSDAVLCGTGWVPSLQFFSQELRAELGIPCYKDSQPVEERKRWERLENAADKTVTATFPQLANPPPHYHKAVKITPYRLYKHVAPVQEPSEDDRSIVFIGQVGVGNYFPVVACQTMWAVAYMDGKLTLPTLAEQSQEVALFTAWCRRRYLSNGEEGNNMTFELIGYTDSLLASLGLSSHRKGWFMDLFQPMFAKDYVGLKEEFIRKYGYGGA